MTNQRFHDLFGGPPRNPDTRIEQRHMDLAASIQAVTEDIVLALGRSLHQQTGMKNLVMAGGVALNCVANGRLLREGPFSNIWIQPGAGDAGGALGIALAIWHRYLGRPRLSGEKSGTWVSSKVKSSNGLLPYADGMKGSYLGPQN